LRKRKNTVQTFESTQEQLAFFKLLQTEKDSQNKAHRLLDEIQRRSKSLISRDHAARKQKKTKGYNHILYTALLRKK